MSQSEINSPSSKTDPAREKRSARMVLFGMIGFFAVFCTVDIFFVYKAISTNTGVVYDKSYEAGLSYDQYAEEAREQHGLTANSKLTFANDTVTLRLLDENEDPIAGAIVTGEAFHTIQERDDIPSFTLHEMSPGEYEAPLTINKKGSWTLKVMANWSEGKETQSYQKTISVIRP